MRFSKKYSYTGVTIPDGSPAFVSGVYLPSAMGAVGVAFRVSGAVLAVGGGATTATVTVGLQFSNGEAGTPAITGGQAAISTSTSGASGRADGTNVLMGAFMIPDPGSGTTIPGQIPIIARTIGIKLGNNTGGGVALSANIDVWLMFDDSTVGLFGEAALT